MADSTISEMAAIGRIAARLSPLVTGGQIAEVAGHFNQVAEGSSKQARLKDLLNALWRDRRRRVDAIAIAIATLTVAGHDRCLAGQNAMTEDDVDAIVRDMRQLGLDPGELAHKKWRTGLRGRSSAGAPPDPHSPKHSAQEPGRRAPQVHQAALNRMNALALDGAIDPRRRGYELQLIVLDVCVRRPIVIARIGAS